MTDRPTPETDAVERGFTDNLRQDPQFRLTIHARHLERQRDDLLEALDVILSYEELPPEYHTHEYAAAFNRATAAIASVKGEAK